jgi:hypothetical protein
MSDAVPREAIFGDRGLHKRTRPLLYMRRELGTPGFPILLECWGHRNRLTGIIDRHPIVSRDHFHVVDVRAFLRLTAPPLMRKSLAHTSIQGTPDGLLRPPVVGRQWQWPPPAPALDLADHQTVARAQRSTPNRKRRIDAMSTSKRSRSLHNR